MNRLEEYFLEFKSFIEANGICEGDIVYVGSDISGILLGARRELDIKDIEEQRSFLNLLITSIQKVVGEKGTLLFPNFSWGFCRGEIFDYKKSHGEIGVLNNYILEFRNDFNRTHHPMYNFMVWGKDAEYLQRMDNQDAWGEDSPFGYLHRNHAKQINLNVPFNKCITFQHYVEQCLNAPYRYKKYFCGEYIDEEGFKTERVYSMYVRDLRIKSAPNLPQSFFLDSQAAKESYFHGYMVIFMELDRIFDCISNDLLNNKGKNIYHFIGYEPIWNGVHTHAREIKLFDNSIIKMEEI